jgi:prepilin-type processing-associated H-X9-DG protein
MGWWWFNHIVDYSGEDSCTDSVIWCPSRQITDRRLENNVLCGNYGVNQSICKALSGRGSGDEFIGKPLRSCDIEHPSATLLIVDSGYSMINWWHATDAPPIALSKTREDSTSYVPGLRINRERDLWPGQEHDAINGRHPNETVNVGFADGHISRIKADDLLVTKTGAGYKGLRPFWLPR